MKHKKITAMLLAFVLSLSPIGAYADEEIPPAGNGGVFEEMSPGGEENETVEKPMENEAIQPFEVEARAAILIESKSGQVLAEWNADEALPPASVTKVMTLLLAMEALDAGKFQLSDSVQISEYAASMGGSQVFLEPGESITVEELIKAVVISSANDGAVALAELVSGDVDSFVALMNRRAGELGMKNSHFENPTGLDDSVVNHVFSARDIAIASRELTVHHPKILEYSSIWMDTIRNGAFGLTNTNRLVRFYRGATGLKTGSTAKARFCISATASRDGLDLIAVVMGSETRDIRNETAKKILDWGFSHYERVSYSEEKMGTLKVVGGKQKECEIVRGEVSFLIEKGMGKHVEEEIVLPNQTKAPVRCGDAVGEVIYRLNGAELGRSEIVAMSEVERIGFGDILLRMLRAFFLCDASENTESGMIPGQETTAETGGHTPSRSSFGFYRGYVNLTCVES